MLIYQCFLLIKEKTEILKKFTILLMGERITFFDFPEIFDVDKRLFLVYYNSYNVFIQEPIYSMKEISGISEGGEQDAKK